MSENKIEPPSDEVRAADRAQLHGTSQGLNGARGQRPAVCRRLRETVGKPGPDERTITGSLKNLLARESGKVDRQGVSRQNELRISLIGVR